MPGCNLLLTEVNFWLPKTCHLEKHILVNENDIREILRSVEIKLYYCNKLKLTRNQLWAIKWWKNHELVFDVVVTMENRKTVYADVNENCKLLLI